MRALTLGLVAGLLVPATLSAQTRTQMGSVEDYLMDRPYEIALARSAAPAPVSDGARILVFTEAGYEEAAPGGNGFTCLVERSWSSPFGPHDDFYNPRMRAPICFNRAASEAQLQEYLRRTELALAGETWTAVRDSVAADITSGALRPPNGLGMSYMMSHGQILGSAVNEFVPHVMFYRPFVTRSDIGAHPENERAMMFEYEGGPFSAIIVPVGVWIEVEAPGGGDGGANLEAADGGVQRPSEAGWVSVPEDRSADTGTHIRLRVAVQRPDTPGGPPDPIVLLVGGPGDGALGASGSFGPVLRALFPTHDLVFLDQRGTGESNGLFCPDDRAPVDGPRPGLFGSIFPVPDVQRCRRSLEDRADLTAYATPDAADDLADVLDALGYERANLLALSYGTRLAQVFARRHPERVRTMVLSGAMSFDIQAPLHYARDAQSALDRLVDACLGQDDCRARYPDLPSRIDAVWNALAEGPIRVEHRFPASGNAVPVELGSGDVGYAVRGMLYTTAGQEALPAALSAASTGDWSGLIDAYVGRRARTFATGLHLSVLCSEEVRFITSDQAAKATQGTFLGGYIVDDMRAACASWPTAELDERYHTPLESDVPTLLVSGEFDPVTPPRWAESIAKRLPASRHVVIPGGGHGLAQIRGGPACLGRIVATFVASADPDSVDPSCLDATPPPAFRD